MQFVRRPAASMECVPVLANRKKGRGHSHSGGESSPPLRGGFAHLCIESREIRLQIPVGNLPAGCHPDLIVARDVTENSIKMTDPMWLTDQERMQRKVHDTSVLGTVLIQTVEHLDGRLCESFRFDAEAEIKIDPVVYFKLVGQRQQASSTPYLDRKGLLVEAPIAIIFDAGFSNEVRRFDRE